ncbi:carboxyltransferase domain-containing protein [Psychromonas sp. L1A2]|uniref:carboxyltransferase domain-containing protein n=1 Tax=Psychromonas sp. L1A2 TaxID=2686356 RepID=UPI003FA7DEFF
MVLQAYYGIEVALDHEAISKYTGLAFSEIIKLHTEEYYYVFVVGIKPSFTLS